MEPETRDWLRARAPTAAALLAVFLLAFFVRAYFGYVPATEDGFLVSGGSDSYYYKWTIDHVIETGGQLADDPMLNYPIGLVNPRPPGYTWFNALGGLALSPFVGGVENGVWYVLLFSTALWGALTVFPVYLITKEGFGRRAGLLAAFLLAVLPAHLQRSPLSNADHDAMVLFFVVTSFFFFLRALKELKEETWVPSWKTFARQPAVLVLLAVFAAASLGLALNRMAWGISVLVIPAFAALFAFTPLRAFARANRTSVLYALLAAFALGTVALTWQGYMYAIVILLGYLVIQLLLHRFRNRDVFGIVVLFALTVGGALFLAFPHYVLNNYIFTWFDVPSYLFLLALGLGLFFAVTRAYPWAFTIPATLIVGGAGLLVFAIFNPRVADLILTGAGYLVRSKVIETIAEAQAPGISQIIVSFGVATFFFSLFGVMYSLYQIPRRFVPDYLFLVVWSGMAILMSMTSARFIFNASPAFAMTSGWVLALAIERLRFDEVRRTYRALRGNPLTAFRKSVRVRHVVFAAGIAFLVVLPNVWYSVDAGIPYEEKLDYDKQIHNALPSVLRPSGADSAQTQGQTFYLGAFGYSLPLPRRYWPAAWRWFSSQDAQVLSAPDRPAFISWWDYGFEAINEGQHPTVADNFQDGYQLAGNFLMAQSEEEAIALLTVRLMEGDWIGNTRSPRFAFTPAVRGVLVANGLDADLLHDVFLHSADYADDILADPARFGVKDARMEYLNARYIMAETLIMEKLDLEGVAGLYRAVQLATGHTVRYFAVDARLFPFSGSNTGIFYAPAKLSDHRMLELRDGRSLPIDFYSITAVTESGELPIQNLTGTEQVNELKIAYTEMFYDTMLYRAYMGFGPSDVGQSCTDCIPGFTGTLQGLDPLQGWNLTHFRVVYRTGYYNPYPSDEVQNHTDAWTAANVFDVLDLARRIARGEANGTVDPSARSGLTSGVVFLKYYEGAVVNGTLLVDGVTPLAGALVTVKDELDVPHGAVLTDAAGRFSLLAPFGAVKLVASVGNVDKRAVQGTQVLNTTTINITDDQAMRRAVDRDADGRVDWLIQQDLTVKGITVQGRAFADLDGNNQYDATDVAAAGATVTVTHVATGQRRTVAAGADGTFTVPGSLTGAYRGTAHWQGRDLGGASANLTATATTLDLPLPAGKIEGTVIDAAEDPVPGATVRLNDETNGTTFQVTSDAEGGYAFPALLAGNFTLSAETALAVAEPRLVELTSGANATHELTVYPAGTLLAVTSAGGMPTSNVLVRIERTGARYFDLLVPSGPGGVLTLRLPEGRYTAYARHTLGATTYAFLGEFLLAAGGSLPFPVDLRTAHEVSGLVYLGERTAAQGAAVVVFDNGNGRVTTRADPAGVYRAFLPSGSYDVYVSAGSNAFFGRATVTGRTTLDIAVTSGERIDGAAYFDQDRDGTRDVGEGIGDALVTFLSTDGSGMRFITAADGTFRAQLPLTGTFTLRIEAAGFDPAEVGPLAAESLRTRASLSLSVINVTVEGDVATEPDVNAEGLEVRFLAAGGGAVDAAVPISNGGYVIDLRPGQYEVALDAPLPGGDRVQLRQDVGLTVSIAAASVRQDLDLVRRTHLNGTLGANANPVDGTVRATGPEAFEAVTQGGSFSFLVIRGTYSLYANATVAADEHAALLTATVSGPTALTVNLTRAVRVSGALLHQGTALSRVTTLTFASADGEVHVDTSTNGRYEVRLPPGSYNASAAFSAMATVGGQPRFVRYSHAGTLTLTAAQVVATYDVPLQRVLENATVTGVVRFGVVGTAASLTFQASNATAMNATGSASFDGTYAVSLQPGRYDLYGRSSAGNLVAMAKVTVAPGNLSLDVTLEQGFPLQGSVRLVSGSAVATDVAIAGPANLTVVSGANGLFSTAVPSGTYTVRAQTSLTERGVAVTYATSLTVNVTEPSTADLVLEKQVRRTVQVTWDAAQRATIPAGGFATYRVDVRNTGNVDDAFRLSGALTGWTFDFTPDEVPVRFGSTGNSAEVQVKITSPAGALVDHPALTITARSVNDTSAQSSVSVQVDIVPRFGVTAERSAGDARGDTVTLTVRVRNTGNVRDNYTLAVVNAAELEADGWNVSWTRTLFGSATDQLTGVQVNANSTVDVFLRLEGAGRASVAKVAADSETSGAASAVADLAFSPSRLEPGTIRVEGKGITTAPPETPVFGYLLVGIAGAFGGLAVYTLRRRRR